MMISYVMNTNILKKNPVELVKKLIKENKF